MNSTGRGPSSKEDARTPSGASQKSPGILHRYVAEHICGLVGLTPSGYTGLVLGIFDDLGMSGTLPAATASLNAATQFAGMVLGPGAAPGGGNPALHSIHGMV
jgi:hypothetical protein